jgi:hypothetical protein
MQNRMLGKTMTDLGKFSGWLDGAGRHSAIALLGALAVAIVAFQQTPPSTVNEHDVNGEEVPLFI